MRKEGEAKAFGATFVESYIKKNKPDWELMSSSAHAVLYGIFGLMFVGWVGDSHEARIIATLAVLAAWGRASSRILGQRARNIEDSRKMRKFLLKAQECGVVHLPYVYENESGGRDYVLPPEFKNLPSEIRAQQRLDIFAAAFGRKDQPDKSAAQLHFERMSGVFATAFGKKSNSEKLPE